LEEESELPRFINDGTLSEFWTRIEAADDRQEVNFYYYIMLPVFLIPVPGFGAGRT